MMRKLKAILLLHLLIGPATRDTTAEWHPCGARRPGGVLGRHEHGGHGSEAAAEAEAVEDAAAAPISLAPLGDDGNATVTS